MRAVRLSRFGDPDVLEVVTLPVPEPGPGEVRINVDAATVNPTDLLTRSGYRGKVTKHIELPVTLGMEVAGVVDAVGEGASWSVGDRVMALTLPFGPHGGGYAEQVVVPTHLVGFAPSGISSAQAAGLPMNGLTALVTMDVLGLEPGQTIAVTGAAGCVGGYVVQLAKSRGLAVIADASGQDRELVQQLGADEVVARGPDVAAAIRAVAPGGVPALVDASVQHGEVVPAIADGGLLVLMRDWDEEPSRGVVKRFVTVVEGIGKPTLFDELRKAVETGVLTTRVAHTFPAEEAAEAHRTLGRGGVRGRVVLTF